MLNIKIEPLNGAYLLNITDGQGDWSQLAQDEQFIDLEDACERILEVEYEYNARLDSETDNE